MRTVRIAMQKRFKQKVNGWLISPDGNWCYRFHHDPKSWQRYPFIYVDKWSAQPDGSPSQMTVRRKLPLDDALELCGQMLLDGWKTLSNQFGEVPNVDLSEEVAA